MPRASKQAVSSRQSGQIHIPSASRTAWCSGTDVICLSCHQGGKQAACCHFRSVQRCMQAVRCHTTVSPVRLSKPLTHSASSQPPHQANSPSVRATKVKARWTWHHAADKPNRLLLFSQGKCSRTVQTSLCKEKSSCWERQISLMFKAASKCSLWHRIPVCFTRRKAHWNCSTHHPLSYGNRAFISTKERSRAKVNWALCTTPEHFTLEGFG